MFNQKLKFSWGHIFAFVALLFIAYMTFLSVTYYTLGNYILAGVITFAVDVSLLILFISLQRLKACDHRFQKNIRRERILFVVSFILFLILMIPFLKGWSVIKDNDKIIQNFKSAINESKNIFASYERYSELRINKYKQRLESIATSVKSNKQKSDKQPTYGSKHRSKIMDLDSIHPNDNNTEPMQRRHRSKIMNSIQHKQVPESTLPYETGLHRSKIMDSIHHKQDCSQQIIDLYKEIGFDGEKDSFMIENRITLLKLQIDSTNYEKIRDNALQWIEQANQGGSVWNVFLFGNLKTIKSSISSWHSSLQEFSSKKFVAEEESIMEFDKENKILNSAINSIDQLENIYKQSKELYIWGLVTMILAYLFLLMPWIVQERNTKSREKILSINNIKKKSETNSTDWFGDSNTNNTDNNKDKEGYKHKPF